MEDPKIQQVQMRSCLDSSLRQGGKKGANKLEKQYLQKTQHQLLGNFKES
jgi:hypothetical protein